MTRVLLIDDETIILHVLTSYLKAWNFEVTAISDNRKAAETIKSKEQFDIMISDIRMFPINGIELLKLSKEIRPEMPVILVTGFGSKETFKQAEELGAFRCLSKPFEPSALLETVQEALKSKE